MRPRARGCNVRFIVEAFVEGRKRAEIAARHGISVYTYDNHLQAAFRSLRDWMIQVVDISTDVDRPHWYDVVEKLNERHTAARLRRVSDRKGKRSTSERDRSNFEGERSNSEGDRGKNSRAGAA